MAPSLNQLRYFCELADAGNFGRAAARLHMSQPPLSRQIAALEQDLGIALFVRSPKGVALTAAGRQFLLDASDILQRVAQAKRNATATGRGEAGSFSMGFTMCAAYSVVPDLTRRYKRAPVRTLRTPPTSAVANRSKADGWNAADRSGHKR